MNYFKKKSGLISEINYQDANTWENKIFFTTDIDWAHDDIIQSCIDFFEQMKCKVTWFVTHDTPKLNRIRENKNFEFGIHPNFNPLLINGSYEKGRTANEIISSIKEIVPEAKSVRSHSLTQNSYLLKSFYDLGIKYELNTFIEPFENIYLKPFRYHFDIIKLPYIWQDDTHMECGYDYKECLESINSSKGLTIINFHPVHLFLNCENMDRYNYQRQHLKDFEILEMSRNNNSFGVRNFFEEICEKLIA